MRVYQSIWYLKIPKITITKLSDSHYQMEQQLVNVLSIDIELQQMIILTKSLLSDMIENQGYQCTSIFNSTQQPSIDLDAFIHRIHKYTKFSPHCLIMAIIYIDRYNMAKPEFSLNWFNVHKILLSCLLLAVKFHDDLYYDNKAFQLAGGVNTSQLFSFEMEIFKTLNFTAWIGYEEFDALLTKLYDVYQNP